MNKFYGAMLLISGTSIGAGMLALPVTTASYGLLPAILLFICSWTLLAFTALLMLEVNLWLPPDSNIISMARHTLGKTGQIVAWASYLLLMYSLMAAYLSGINDLIRDTLISFFHLHITQWVGALILILLFATIIYQGARTIDKLNRLLIFGLVIFYLILLTFISPHIKLQNLDTVHFGHIWIVIPIAITAFGFHVVIPSLRTYLEGNVKKLRLAIIIGSVIPLIIYILWETIILGVVPKKDLLTVMASGQPAYGLTYYLKILLNNPYIATCAAFFGFFAISTSFVGISFSLFDFLADGFAIKKTRLGRVSTAMLTFIPPLIFTLTYPRGFIIALGYAGVFVAILLGILPALMALSGRYWLKIATGYRVSGGIVALILAILCSCVVIIVEFLPKLAS